MDWHARRRRHTYMHAYVPREERGRVEGGKKRAKRRAEHCVLALRRERPVRERGRRGGQSTRVCEQSSTAIRRSSREANAKTGVGIDTVRESLRGIQHSCEDSSAHTQRQTHMCALGTHRVLHRRVYSPPPPPPLFTSHHATRPNEKKTRHERIHIYIYILYVHVPR